MNKPDFTHFVQRSLEELIQSAEIYAEKELPRDSAFKWADEDIWEFEETEVLRKLVDRIYLAEDQIYPCVDLVVKGLVAGRVEGRIAGYEPRPFQKGWSGRMGPFIYSVGFGSVTDKVKLDSIRNKLIQKGLLPG